MTIEIKTKGNKSPIIISGSNLKEDDQIKKNRENNYKIALISFFGLILAAIIQGLFSLFD